MYPLWHFNICLDLLPILLLVLLRNNAVKIGAPIMHWNNIWITITYQTNFIMIEIWNTFIGHSSFYISFKKDVKLYIYS